MFTAIARTSEVPSFAKLEAEQQQIILRALKAQGGVAARSGRVVSSRRMR